MFFCPKHRLKTNYFQQNKPTFELIYFCNIYFFFFSILAKTKSKKNPTSRLGTALKCPAFSQLGLLYTLGQNVGIFPIFKKKFSFHRRFIYFPFSTGSNKSYDNNQCCIYFTVIIPHWLTIIQPWSGITFFWSGMLYWPSPPYFWDSGW